MKKLILTILCATSSFTLHAQALKMGSTRDKIEKILGTKLEPSEFKRTFNVNDFKVLKAELPEPFREFDIKSAQYSFDDKGKLWRVYVRVNLPSDVAFEAFEKTSDILSKKHNVPPMQKGISETLPVIDSCSDYRGNGAPVGEDFKKKWKTMTQPQRKAFTMNCGDQFVPFLVDQHRDKNNVIEVVSFEKTSVPVSLGDAAKVISEYLSSPVQSALVFRVIKANKTTPGFMEAEVSQLGYFLR